MTLASLTAPPTGDLAALDVFWSILVQTAGPLLIGLVLAGVLQAWVSGRWLATWLGRERPGAVILATLIGAPLPLCSCGVLPTALTLHRAGAGRGPTLSFLISTPETSVTSILVTYALIGPWMAVVRPLAAMATALVAGFAQLAFGEAAPSASAADAGDTDCGAGDCADDEGLPTEAPGLAAGMRYASFDLFDDIFVWVVVGILAAGAVAVFLPPDLLASGVPGWVGLLGALIIGIPLYICAEASTPVAAALMFQGLSPGAALVLLLAGPATNIGALGLLRRELGQRSVVIYLGSIVVVSLAAGAALDVALGAEAPELSASVLTGNVTASPLAVAASVAFLLLGVAGLARRFARHRKQRAARAHQ